MADWKRLDGEVHHVTSGSNCVCCARGVQRGWKKKEATTRGEYEKTARVDTCELELREPNAEDVSYFVEALEAEGGEETERERESEKEREIEREDTRRKDRQTLLRGCWLVLRFLCSKSSFQSSFRWGRTERGVIIRLPRSSVQEEAWNRRCKLYFKHQRWGLGGQSVSGWRSEKYESRKREERAWKEGIQNIYYFYICNTLEHLVKPFRIIECTRSGSKPLLKVESVGVWGQKGGRRLAI